MALLRVEWDKHNGAMLKLSETTAGLESTTGDLIGQFAGAALSGAKMDTAYKGVLATLNTFLRRSTEMIQGKSSVTTLTKKIEYQQKQLESWQKGMVNASDRNIPNFVARIGETTAEIIVLENAMKRLTDTTMADSAARVSWAQSRLAWARQMNTAQAEETAVVEDATVALIALSGSGDGWTFTLNKMIGMTGEFNVANGQMVAWPGEHQQSTSGDARRVRECT